MNLTKLLFLTAVVMLLAYYAIPFIGSAIEKQTQENVRAIRGSVKR